MHPDELSLSRGHGGISQPSLRDLRLMRDPYFNRTPSLPPNLTNLCLGVDAQYFFRLPREIRDVVYAYLLLEDEPITSASRPHSIINQYHGQPLIATEAAEFFYNSNTITVHLDPRFKQLTFCPWGSGINPSEHVKKLVVYAKEGIYHIQKAESGSFEKRLPKEAREMWDSLYSFPKLEYLEVRIMKEQHYCTTVDRPLAHNCLEARDFWPVLCQLRRQNRELRQHMEAACRLNPELRLTVPKELKIKVMLSVDDMFEAAWNEPAWRTRHPDQYEKSGYMDITSLIMRPRHHFLNLPDDWEDFFEYMGSNYFYPFGCVIVRSFLGASVQDRRRGLPGFIVRNGQLFGKLQELNYRQYMEEAEKNGKIVQSDAGKVHLYSINNPKSN
jgi:hypothetical protein